MTLLESILNVFFNIQLIFHSNVVQGKVFMFKGPNVLYSDEENITERNDLNSWQNGYSIPDQSSRWSYWVDFPLEKLVVNLIKDFSLVYIQPVCLGEVLRLFGRISSSFHVNRDHWQNRKDRRQQSWDFCCFIQFQHNFLQTCARLLFMLLQHLFASARLHRVHENFCYRKVQYIICTT